MTESCKLSSQSRDGQRGVPEFRAQNLKVGPSLVLAVVAMAKGRGGDALKSPLALSTRCTYMMLLLGAPLLLLLGTFMLMNTYTLGNLQNGLQLHHLGKTQR